MRETWGFLDCGHHDAAINMAVDEALLEWHREGIIPPTIRFYGWKRPSLSVGHFQNVEKTIDFTGVQKHRCDLVRRLTGGSAVLHDDELTYSIVVSESHPMIPRSVNRAYYILSQGLLESYRLLGINAQFSISKHDLLRKRTAVCFEKPAIYEMIVDGKKISGNAQVRKTGVLLQHGSIPISFDIDMLFDLFKFSSEAERESKRQSFYQKATSIKEVTGRSYTYETLKEVFLKGFQKKLNVKIKPIKLSDNQWQYIDYLAESKYRTKLWNKARSQRSV